MCRAWSCCARLRTPSKSMPICFFSNVTSHTAAHCRTVCTPVPMCVCIYVVPLVLITTYSAIGANLHFCTFCTLSIHHHADTHSANREYMRIYVLSHCQQCTYVHPLKIANRAYPCVCSSYKISNLHYRRHKNGKKGSPIFRF